MPMLSRDRYLPMYNKPYPFKIDFVKETTNDDYKMEFYDKPFTY